MQGKLFTPIGGGQILEYIGKNYFKGTLDGKNHTISNLIVLNEFDSGLFGISSATSYTDLSVLDALFVSTKGSIGGIVAIQDANTGTVYKGNAVFDNVKVININYLHTLHIEEDAIVGGLVGQSINTVLRIENSAISELDISKHGVNVKSNRNKITQGKRVGGVLGQSISSTVQIGKANNVFDITGSEYVGGLIGYADSDSKLELSTSYNLGTIKAVTRANVPTGVAGGLVGYAEGSININQCYNTSAVIAEIASGMIGLTDSSNISISFAYVSRGDKDAEVGGEINKRDDANNINNMNDNVIVGNTQSAFVNVSNETGVNIVLKEVYCSLNGLPLTNLTSTTGLNYHAVFVISSKNSDMKMNVLNEITHASLSEPNNDLLFDDWDYTWDRVSQKNNNYPVLRLTASMWGAVDGDKIEKDEPSAEGTIYYIKSPEELAWVAEQVNLGKDNFENDTIVVLGDDDGNMDFKFQSWNPIGHSDSTAFKGNVEFRGREETGNKVTIINLGTNGYYDENYTLHDDYVGLFGYMSGSNISGKLLMTTDSSTANEGSHINGRSNYVGALAGYAINVNLNDAEITNKLNVQGFGNYIGGIFGQLVYSSSVSSVVTPSATSRAATTVSLGKLINYGYVHGKEDNTSEYIAGVIGHLTTTTTVFNINIVAETIENYGEIQYAGGDIAGIIARVDGENINLTITKAVNASNISADAMYVGGLIGYIDGKLTVTNAVLSNDSISAGEVSLLIENKAIYSYLGSVVGWANYVKVSNFTADKDKVKIYSENRVNFSQNSTESGGVGGLVGLARNMDIYITDSAKGLVVNNIEFTIGDKNSDKVSKANNVGGIVGRVTGTFNISANADIVNNDALAAKILVDGVKGIAGIGYIGGVAGHIHKYTVNAGIVDKLSITVNNTSVTETTLENAEYFDSLTAAGTVYEIYGNIGGAFGYIKQGSVECIEIKNITVTATESDVKITGTSSYIGGVFGRLGSYSKLDNIVNNVFVDADPGRYTSFSGGIAGSLGDMTSETTRSELTNLKNTASVTGYSYVGGLFGELFNAEITKSYVVSDTAELVTIGSSYITASTTVKTDNRVGGLVGFANNVYINNLALLSDYTFKGNIIAANYAGGLVGYAYRTNIANARVYINEMSILGGQLSSEFINDERLYVAGGAVGYADGTPEDPSKESALYFVNNIDVEIVDILDVQGNFAEVELIPQIAGVVGYANYYTINEVSVNIARSEGADPEGYVQGNVVGVVGYFYNTKLNSNWYSNNYWVIGSDTTRYSYYGNQEFDYQRSITLVYATNLLTVPVSQYYNSSVVYTTSETSSIIYANTMLNNSHEYIEQTKQIFIEAGLWRVENNADDIVILYMSDDMMLRSASLEFDKEKFRYYLILNEDLQKKIGASTNMYEYMYSAINKRYEVEATGYDLYIEVVNGIDNVLTNTEGNYINAIGTYFFPINNLTIKGVQSEEVVTPTSAEEIKTATITIGSANMMVASSGANTYNLFGLVGQIEGNINIENIVINSAVTSVTAYDNVHNYYDSEDNKISAPTYSRFAGVLLASAFATEHSESASGDIQHEISNVELNVDIDMNDSIEYVGTLIGGAYAMSTTIGGDKSIQLTNIINKGDYLSSSAVVAGGLIGVADFSNTTSELNIIVKKVDDAEDDVHGIKNQGTVSASDVAGGVIGLVGHNVKFDTNSTEDAEYVKNLILNTGSIYGSTEVVGGVIGALSAKIAETTYLANLYSSSASYNGKAVGGIVGRVYSDNFKVSEDDNTISSANVKLQYVYNYSNVTTSAKSVGGIVGELANIGTFEIANSTVMGKVSAPNNSGAVGGFISSNIYNGSDIVIYDITSNRLQSVATSSEAHSVEDIKSINILKFTNVVSASSQIGSTANESAGGIIGEITGTKTVEFLNCQAEGNIIASSNVGGYTGLVKDTAWVKIDANANYGYKTDYEKEKDEYKYQGEYVGGLVGKITGKPTMEGAICVNSTNMSSHSLETGHVTIKGVKYSGGAVGYLDYDNTEDTAVQFAFSHIINNARIENTSSTPVGGILAGYNLDKSKNYTITFSNCTNNADVITDGYAGGMIGYIDNIKKLIIEDCSDNDNAIIESTADDKSAGGLVGEINSATDQVEVSTGASGNNYNDYTVRGNNAGGAVGRVNKNVNVSVSGSILSSGVNIEGKFTAGGVIGWVYWAIANAMVDIGNIHVKGLDGKDPYVGGVFGRVEKSDYEIGEENKNLAGVSGYYAGGHLGYIDVIDGKTSYDLKKIKNTNTINGTVCGGIIGCVQGYTGLTVNIKDCSNSGMVNGALLAGGIIGEVKNVDELVITNCTNTGAITGQIAAGIAARPQANTTIKDCFVGEEDNIVKIKSKTLQNEGDNKEKERIAVSAGVIGYTNYNVVVRNTIVYAEIISEIFGTDAEDIQKLDVTDWSYAGGIAGYIASGCQGAIIQGCQVLSSKIEGYISGGIVGYKANRNGSDASFIIGCSCNYANNKHADNCTGECIVDKTEISAYLYTGGLVGQLDGTNIKYNIEGTRNKLTEITFGALLEQTQEKSFIVNLYENRTYKVNAIETIGKVLVKAKYQTESSSGTYSEEKVIERYYRLATEEKYYTFVENGDYSIVVGNDREFEKFSGTYDSVQFANYEYFKLNDLSSDGYTLSSLTNTELGVKGVEKISNKTPYSTVNTTETLSGTYYSESSAQTAVRNKLATYTEETPETNISAAYLKDLLDGTNESGKNPSKVMYSYVYRIPNTNIYYSSFFGGSNLRNRIVAVAAKELEDKGEAGVNADEWDYRARGVYYNTWYWGNLDGSTQSTIDWAITGRDDGYPLDWCAIFVSYCAAKAGVTWHDKDSHDRPSTTLHNPDGYVFLSAGVGTIALPHAGRGEWICTNPSIKTGDSSWAGLYNSRYVNYTYIPQPGDLIFYDWTTGDGRDGSLDHIGIVEYYKDGYVHTIEGNELQRHSRKYSPGSNLENGISGFVSPSYPVSAVAASSSMRKKMVAIANREYETNGDITLTASTNKYNEWYWGYKNSQAWCNAFTTWVANEAGAIEAGVIPKYAGCGLTIDWFRQRNQWICVNNTTDMPDGETASTVNINSRYYNPNYEPQPGDLIMFDGETGTDDIYRRNGLPDHIGIVESCDETYVYTIEGNTGGSQLKKKKYYRTNKSWIMGYCVPDYPVTYEVAEDLIGTAAEDVWNEVTSLYANDLIDYSTETGRTLRGDVVHSALYAKRTQNTNFTYIDCVNGYVSEGTYNSSSTGYYQMLDDEVSGEDSYCYDRFMAMKNAGIEWWLRGETYYWDVGQIKQAIDSATTDSPITWGTDCCGFIRLVYALNGLSMEPYTSGKTITSPSNLKPGDIVWISNVHVLMFLYSNGNTCYFIDQGNLIKTGTWSGSYFTMSGESSSRHYSTYSTYNF